MIGTVIKPRTRNRRRTAAVFFLAVVVCVGMAAFAVGPAAGAGLAGGDDSTAQVATTTASDPVEINESEIDSDFELEFESVDGVVGEQINVWVNNTAETDGDQPVWLTKEADDDERLVAFDDFVWRGEEGDGLLETEYLLTPDLEGETVTLTAETPTDTAEIEIDVEPGIEFVGEAGDEDTPLETDQIELSEEDEWDAPLLDLDEIEALDPGYVLSEEFDIKAYDEEDETWEELDDAILNDDSYFYELDARDFVCITDDEVVEPETLCGNVNITEGNIDIDDNELLIEGGETQMTLEAAQIGAWTEDPEEERSPLNVPFVIDQSGSMVMDFETSWPHSGEVQNAPGVIDVPDVPDMMDTATIDDLEDDDGLAESLFGGDVYGYECRDDGMFDWSDFCDWTDEDLDHSTEGYHMIFEGWDLFDAEDRQYEVYFRGEDEWVSAHDTVDVEALTSAEFNSDIDHRDIYDVSTSWFDDSWYYAIDEDTEVRVWSDSSTLAFWEDDELLTSESGEEIGSLSQEEGVIRETEVEERTMTVDREIDDIEPEGIYEVDGGLFGDDGWFYDVEPDTKVRVSADTGWWFWSGEETLTHPQGEEIQDLGKEEGVIQETEVDKATRTAAESVDGIDNEDIYYVGEEGWFSDDDRWFYDVDGDTEVSVTVENWEPWESDDVYDGSIVDVASQSDAVWESTLDDESEAYGYECNAHTDGDFCDWTSEDVDGSTTGYVIDFDEADSAEFEGVEDETETTTETIDKRTLDAVEGDISSYECAYTDGLITSDPFCDWTGDEFDGDTEGFYLDDSYNFEFYDEESGEWVEKESDVDDVTYEDPSLGEIDGDVLGYECADTSGIFDWSSYCDWTSEEFDEDRQGFWLDDDNFNFEFRSDDGEWIEKEEIDKQSVEAAARPDVDLDEEDLYWVDTGFLDGFSEVWLYDVEPDTDVRIRHDGLFSDTEKIEAQDREGERFEAVDSFIDMLDPEMDQAAGISFDEDDDELQPEHMTFLGDWIHDWFGDEYEQEPPFDEATYEKQSLTDDLEAAQENIQDDRLQKIIDNEVDEEAEVYGGTNMAAGLEEGLAELEADDTDDSEDAIVLVTNGIHHKVEGELPDTDNLDSKTLELAEQAAQEDVTVYTVGLGPVADGWLLQTVADKTDGEYYHVDEAEELTNQFEELAMTEFLSPAIQRDYAELEAVVDGEAHDLGIEGENINDPERFNSAETEPFNFALDDLSAENATRLGFNLTLYEPADPDEAGISETINDQEVEYLTGDQPGDELATITSNDTELHRIYRDGDTMDDLPVAEWQEHPSDLDAMEEYFNSPTLDLSDSEAIVALTVDDGEHDGYVLMHADATDGADPLAGGGSNFEVEATIDGDDEVTVGPEYDEEITVDVDLENTGDSGTEMVALYDFDDNLVAYQEMELESGETDWTQFDWEPSLTAAGESGNLTVETLSDSNETEEVHVNDGEASELTVDVTDWDTDREEDDLREGYEAGEKISTEVEIENVGDADAENELVWIEIDGTVVGTETVDTPEDEKDTKTIDWAVIGDGDPEDSTDTELRIATADDEEIQEIEVGGADDMFEFIPSVSIDIDLIDLED